MDRWRDVWTDECMDGGMNGKLGRLTDGGIGLKKWRSGCTDKMKGCVDSWMNG